MKSGSRSLGVAFSDGRALSTCAGAVVRADRVVDGLAFATATVGGLDATEAVVDLVDGLARPDVRWLLVAGVAPAWFNLLDLSAIHAETGFPVVAVSFEASEGLEAAIREQFDGAAREARLARYRTLPQRRDLQVGDDGVFVRSVGFDAPADAHEVVRAFTPEGGRPEPLRVARLAARAGRAYAERADGHGGNGVSDHGGDDGSDHGGDGAGGRDDDPADPERRG